MQDKEVRIVSISDTHGMHEEVTKDLPEGDMIICSGDITSNGGTKDVGKFFSWFRDLPYLSRIVIAGNHDWLFEEVPLTAREMLLLYPEITYLQHQSVNVGGLRIFGSPYTPRFYDWAFNVDRSKLEDKWKYIPDGTDIVITHGPPYGHGDKVPLCPRYNPGTNAGCEALLKRVEEVKPAVHVFGHIHSGYGVTKNDSTTFINASVLDDSYKYVNKPILITMQRQDDVWTLK